MQFTAGSCIRFGWETFKKRPWFFIGATVLVGIVEAVIDQPYQIAQNVHAGPLVQCAAYLFSFLLVTLVYMGLYHFTLKAHDSVETVSLADLWSPEHYFSYLGTSILCFLIILIGFVALIIPGVILMLVFAFPFYPVIERGLGPIEALKYSKHITIGHRWTLFVLLLATIGLTLLGLICLLVGVLVALPVMGLANAHAYRTLQTLASEAAPSSPAAI